MGFLVGEVAGSAGDLEGSLLARLARPGVAELIEAFDAIESTEQRAAIVQLVRSLGRGSTK